MDRMDCLAPRAQKAKREQMEKEEKWVFCQLFRYFPCCLSLLLHFEWAKVNAEGIKCCVCACKAASALAQKLLCSGHSFGSKPDDSLSPTEEALSLGTDFHSSACSDAGRRPTAEGAGQAPGEGTPGLRDGCGCATRRVLLRVKSCLSLSLPPPAQKICVFDENSANCVSSGVFLARGPAGMIGVEGQHPGLCEAGTQVVGSQL